jgi:pimeloyl-ACP methyl ester carboxylesterase
MTDHSTENKNIENNWGQFQRNGFTRHEISTSIGRLSYHEAGKGQPIVMMHGIGGGASSLSWAFVAPSFTATHHVIVPDMIGWGLSEHPARPILFEDYVTGLESLLEKHGGNAIVCAQSLAAGFALALAERKPNLISRLILTNPTGLKDFGVDSFPAFVKIILAPLTKTPILNLAFYKALFHRRSFMENWYKTQGFANPEDVSEEIIDGAFYSATRPNAAYSALPFLTGDVHYDIVPYLERTNTPTSIIIGGDQGFVGVRNGNRLAKVRDDFNLFVVEQTKACPELERPDEVTKVIKNILSL